MDIFDGQLYALNSNGRQYAAVDIHQLPSLRSSNGPVEDNRDTMAIAQLFGNIYIYNNCFFIVIVKEICSYT